MASKFTTKELSQETWSDFEKLFSQGGGWDHCCCMHFQRPCSLPKSQHLPTRAQRSVRNHRQKKELLDSGRAHGILVYADKDPVGWCQYGRREELPRIDNSRGYRGLAPAESKFWRITCFVVAKPYRRRGVATAALKAALQTIKRQGGGLVEAFPVAKWESWTFGNVSTHGTVSMFEKQGFQVVAPYSSINVLMRRKV
jgi:GNAT superfamily N-acetyltransferase